MSSVYKDVSLSKNTMGAKVIPINRRFRFMKLSKGARNHGRQEFWQSKNLEQYKK